MTDVAEAPTPPTHLPMDEASRMQRAAEMGFDVNQPRVPAGAVVEIAFRQ